MEIYTINYNSFYDCEYEYMRISLRLVERNVVIILFGIINIVPFTRVSVNVSKYFYMVVIIKGSEETSILLDDKNPFARTLNL